jgi:hypothetical protein
MAVFEIEGAVYPCPLGSGKSGREFREILAGRADGVSGVWRTVSFAVSPVVTSASPSMRRTPNTPLSIWWSDRRPTRRGGGSSWGRATSAGGPGA